MKVVTYGDLEYSNGLVFVVSHEGKVVTSFASNTGLVNAAQVHLTKEECVRYATELLVAASKL